MHAYLYVYVYDWNVLRNTGVTARVSKVTFVQLFVRSLQKCTLATTVAINGPKNKLEKLSVISRAQFSRLGKTG